MSGLRFDALIAFFDNLPFRKARVKGLGKESTVYVVYPYGLTANAPEGALCVSWQVSGQESDRVAIADFPQSRPKDLAPGEVVVSNYLTGSEVRFSANGDIDITAVSNVNITATTALTITAPDVTITGAVEITGTIANNGTTIGDDHIHSQGNDSNGDSEADTGTPHA